ncbi:GTP-binding protein [Romeria aff. gracilis LEGE 07310]|uniref:GTP-binding protein n=1 Tax=Vasconcelosia minhoensis LEGE 07310 TaxID=915328 RepID=A0A8J7A9V7_9CYAN|nr:GTP-binding protein [Romeria gracilis]MBE9078880.1 GTP-binding protein [Romeria aff. gracilis LEGE 07310]
MRWLRVLSLAVGALLLVGLLLWLVDSLSRLYAGVAAVSPLLAQMLVLLVGLIVLAALGVIAYYAWLFLRPRRRSQPQPPATRVEAAEANLQAVRQQVAQIQDTVAQQALQQQSQGLADRFIRQSFHLVVFGTGSAGKTSLVNALMGEIAGPVAPTLGTTTVGQTYRLAVPGLSQEVWLTDTPGLLEAGVAGTERSRQAKQLATSADLLLFVIDDDIHRAEYEPLQALAQIGKRAILVLNKIDRYPDADRQILLQRLRDRASGLLAPEDVVAIAAQPQAVPLSEGGWFQPEPDIARLIDRIIAILRSEGADLMADSLLLQSQQLSENARTLLTAQRQQQADAIVDRYQWIGAGVLAATPLPVVDMLATAAVNTQMVVELGKVYGVEVSIEDAKTLALSLAKTLTGLGIVKGAMQLLAVGLQTNLATAVAGKLVQGVSAAYLTRIAGKSFIEYFQQHQDWGDGGMQAVIERQYQLNRRDDFLRQFLQTAIERVIQPPLAQ